MTLPPNRYLVAPKVVEVVITEQQLATTKVLLSKNRETATATLLNLKLQLSRCTDSIQIK